MTDIAGRNAVVTGGGSGIGRALAKALAAAGARVAVADIMMDSAIKVAEEITTAGGKAVAVSCDVCERESIAQLQRDAVAALGPITLLVANAGATSFEKLTDMSDADVDWIFQVNLMGVTYCLQQFLPGMIAHGTGGHVLATASAAGLLPGWVPRHGPYSAAKLGILGMMLNLQAELSEYDIGTTTYCPGGVATGMKDNNERYRPARFGGPGPGPVKVPNDWVHQHLNMLPPDAIAPLVIHGIRANRRIVVDHSNQRQPWIETYQRYVLEAFADAEAFEKTQTTTAA